MGHHQLHPSLQRVVLLDEVRLLLNLMHTKSSRSEASRRQHRASTLRYSSSRVFAYSRTALCDSSKTLTRRPGLALAKLGDVLGPRTAERLDFSSSGVLSATGGSCVTPPGTALPRAGLVRKPLAQLPCFFSRYAQGKPVHQTDFTDRSETMLKVQVQI